VLPLPQILGLCRKWCDFVVFNDNLNRIEITRIERDEGMIKKLQEGLAQGIRQIKEIMEKINRIIYK